MMLPTETARPMSDEELYLSWFKLQAICLTAVELDVDGFLARAAEIRGPDELPGTPFTIHGPTCCVAIGQAVQRLRDELLALGLMGNTQP